MKKFFFTVTAVLAGTVAMAQGPYISANVGYGLGFPSQVLGTDYEVTTSGSETESNIYGTLGAGFNVGVTPGYMLSENFGLEIGLNYFIGSTVDVARAKSPFGELTGSAHSNQFRILPSLVVTSSGDVLKVYGKATLVLPVGGTTFGMREDTGVFGPGSGSTTETETKGAFSLGLGGTIGLNYSLSEKLSLFGELSSMNLHINAKEREVVKATSNGTDVMSFLTTYDKNITYVDDLNSSSNNAAYNANYTEDQPQEVLRTRNNFSALFINLGIKFNL